MALERTADPLARYAPQHRGVIRVQARDLARLMAAAMPPTARGGRSGAQWEDAFYVAILEQCDPHLRTPEIPDRSSTKRGGEG